jgi:hypothetical protein
MMVAVKKCITDGGGKLQNCQEKIQGTGDGAGYAEYPN